MLFIRFENPPADPIEETPLVVTLLPAASPPEPVRDRTPGPVRIKHASQPPRPVEKAVPDLPPVPVSRDPVPIRVEASPLSVSVPAPPVPRTTAPIAEPAPPAPEAAGRDTSFEARLLRHINRFRRYPAAAKRMNDQGVVHLRVRMARSGELLSTRIIRSSGHSSLDKAALATLRRADPLPKIPIDRPAPLELVVPVEFFIE